LVEDGQFRKDFFSFAWRKKRDQTVYQWQYLLPQGLRWIGEIMAELITSKSHKAFLKLDTQHFKEAVIANVGHFTFQVFCHMLKLLNLPDYICRYVRKHSTELVELSTLPSLHLIITTLRDC
jgi:hypothetical protein